MTLDDHYLKRELYELVETEPSVFEFLQHGALDGIWYWDLENPEAEWMSSRFWELLGYDPDEMQHLASEWQKIIDPNDLALTLENFDRHCENPEHPYDQVVRYRHKDGSTVWVRCRGLAIRDETGRPTRLLGAHYDVTQLKRTEEKLRAHTIELERLNGLLQNALDEVSILHGLLPICSSCKKIEDNGSWVQMESYVRERSEADFTHGICPECYKKLYPEFAD